MQSLAQARGLLHFQGHPLHRLLVSRLDGFAALQGPHALGHCRGDGEEPPAGSTRVGHPEGVERHSEDGQSGKGKGELSA